ncbi:MAG: hypothetical protein Q8R48_00575, partial [Candidatus Omnitrophota bacterium]|nr:hypothetical protein [Candidatus Omnitrophota bacterium]
VPGKKEEKGYFDSKEFNALDSRTKSYLQTGGPDGVMRTLDQRMDDMLRYGEKGVITDGPYAGVKVMTYKKLHITDKSDDPIIDLVFEKHRNYKIWQYWSEYDVKQHIEPKASNFTDLQEVIQPFSERLAQAGLYRVDPRNGSNGGNEITETEAKQMYFDNAVPAENSDGVLRGLTDRDVENDLAIIEEYIRFMQEIGRLPNTADDPQKIEAERLKLKKIFFFSRKTAGRRRDLAYDKVPAKGGTQDYLRVISSAGQNDGVYLVIDDDTELLPQFFEDGESEYGNVDGVIAGMFHFVEFEEKQDRLVRERLISEAQKKKLGWVQFESYTIEPNISSFARGKSAAERGYWSFFLPVRSGLIKNAYGRETGRGFIPCNGHNVMIRESMLREVGGWAPHYKPQFMVETDEKYAADRAKINQWIIDKKLNQYGDSLDTVYTDENGDPSTEPLLYNPITGEHMSRYEYILVNHPGIVKELKLERITLMALIAEDLGAVLRGSKYGYEGRFAQYARIGEGSAPDFFGSSVPSWKWGFGSTELIVKLLEEIVENPELSMHEKLDIMINLSTFPAHLPLFASLFTSIAASAAGMPNVYSSMEPAGLLSGIGFGLALSPQSILIALAFKNALAPRKFDPETGQYVSPSGIVERVLDWPRQFLFFAKIFPFIIVLFTGMMAETFRGTASAVLSGIKDSERPTVKIVSGIWDYVLGPIFQIVGSVISSAANMLPDVNSITIESLRQLPVIGPLFNPTLEGMLKDLLIRMGASFKEDGQVRFPPTPKEWDELSYGQLWKYNRFGIMTGIVWWSLALLATLTTLSPLAGLAMMALPTIMVGSFALAPLLYEPVGGKATRADYENMTFLQKMWTQIHTKGAKGILTLLFGAPIIGVPAMVQVHQAMVAPILTDMAMTNDSAYFKAVSDEAGIEDSLQRLWPDIKVAMNFITVKEAQKVGAEYNLGRLKALLEKSGKDWRVVIEALKELEKVKKYEYGEARVKEMVDAVLEEAMKRDKKWSELDILAFLVEHFKANRLDYEKKVAEAREAVNSAEYWRDYYKNPANNAAQEQIDAAEKNYKDAKERLDKLENELLAIQTFITQLEEQKKHADDIKTSNLNDLIGDIPKYAVLQFDGIAGLEGLTQEKIDSLHSAEDVIALLKDMIGHAESALKVADMELKDANKYYSDILSRYNALKAKLAKIQAEEKRLEDRYVSVVGEGMRAKIAPYHELIRGNFQLRSIFKSWDTIPLIREVLERKKAEGFVQAEVVDTAVPLLPSMIDRLNGISDNFLILENDLKVRLVVLMQENGIALNDLKKFGIVEGRSSASEIADTKEFINMDLESELEMLEAFIEAYSNGSYSYAAYVKRFAKYADFVERIGNRREALNRLERIRTLMKEAYDVSEELNLGIDTFIQHITESMPEVLAELRGIRQDIMNKELNELKQKEADLLALEGDEVKRAIEQSKIEGSFEGWIRDMIVFYDDLADEGTITRSQADNITSLLRNDDPSKPDLVDKYKDLVAAIGSLENIRAMAEKYPFAEYDAQVTTAE